METPDTDPLEASEPSYAVQLPTARPVVTYTLIGVNILVFLLQLASQFALEIDVPLALGAKINEYIAAGEWWRLLTPMLLHGSIMHIGFNTYALYVIGSDLERFYGHARLFGLYLVAGFAGNVLSFVLSPDISVGASTAIFGLFGAQGVFVWRHRWLFGERWNSAVRNLLTLVVINLVIGLSPGIDSWGHLGGLIGGVLFAWLGGPLLHIAGEPPFLGVVDARTARQGWTAAAVVALLFILLSVLGANQAAV